MKRHPVLLAGQAAPEMLRPAFWTGGAVLSRTGEEIRLWNRMLFRDPGSGLTDLVTFPFYVDGSRLKTLLLSRALPEGCGAPLAEERRRTLLSRCGAENISERVKVGWGIVVTPADLRRFPTDAVFTGSLSSHPCDLFQETQLRPGTGVALLHVSPDGQWAFLRSADSLGWARCRLIQRCSRSTFLRTLRQWQSYVLPLRPELLLRIAFSRLGMPYRWGRTDCSELVCALYRRFGLLLPRNTAQMAALAVGVHPFSARADEPLARLPAGSLLLMPGHVMFYLGLRQGEPYALHNFTRYYDREGREHPVCSTAVTSLSDLYGADGQSFLDRVNAVMLPGEAGTQ